MKDLYEILEIKRTATQTEIKKAHRKLVKKHHPDKGGDKEAFNDIQKAYEVLSNEERRARYDATGEYEEVRDEFQSKWTEFINSVIMPEIQKRDDYNFDLMRTTNVVIEDAYDRGEKEIYKVKKKIKLFEGSLLRIRYKGDETDLVSEMIKSEITRGEEMIIRIQKEMKMLDRLKEEVDKYEWEYAPEELTDEVKEDARNWINCNLGMP